MGTTLSGPVCLARTLEQLLFFILVFMLQVKKLRRRQVTISDSAEPSAGTGLEARLCGPGTCSPAMFDMPFIQQRSLSSRCVSKGLTTVEPGKLN